MPPSSSERRDAYHRLHPEIQRWIREQGWSELREVQERSIHAVLDGDGHVLILASTAAGKTEAAFLPILTRAAERTEPGLSVLYVSPLKALINDQHRRLSELCERMEIPLVRWHGDAPQADKTRTLRSPRGVALITPESIEAMFVRRAGALPGMLGSVDFVVIDELHSFLAGPRGLHLSSLLNRMDSILGRPARRVGLSATIGDPAMAAAWLAPDDASAVTTVDSGAGAPELRLQVRAVFEPHDTDDPDGLEDDEPGRAPRALDLVADHAFATLRGDNHLLFAGSRRRTEALVDRLRSRCERAGVPNEFFPHHGSLSKELREELEGRLKDDSLPTTAVATTTLELGIDVGSVKSVAQVGAPRSLASLRQRLGRSGRREAVPAILRVYVRERELDAASDPLDLLRLEVVRAVAAVRLLVAKFVEPPSIDPAVATVVLHQTLSIICERGGERAPRLYEAICGRGPLAALGKAQYATLLRAMATPEAKLIEQAPDGTIMLGEAGERVTTAQDFYAIFQSDDEWRLVTKGRTLGTIPIANAVGVGSLLAFAGQRWRVVGVDDRTKTLEVEFHRSGKLPKFEGLGREPLHDRLVAEMREVYRASDVPPFLDANAKPLLANGRAAYREFDLERTPFVKAGNDIHVMLWRGTALSSMFAIALAAVGIECSVHDIGVSAADAAPDRVADAVRSIADGPPITADALAASVGNLREAKYDEFVPEAVLRALWAQRHRPLETALREAACAALDPACGDPGPPRDSRLHR